MASRLAGGLLQLSKWASCKESKPYSVSIGRSTEFCGCNRDELDVLPQYTHHSVRQPCVSVSVSLFLMVVMLPGAWESSVLEVYVKNCGASSTENFKKAHFEMVSL